MQFIIILPKNLLALSFILSPVMKNILCFGEILWDAFGDEKVAGGAPMNVARHLVQQGADVLFASSVGKLMNRERDWFLF